MEKEDRKQTGRTGLSMAITYFTLQGYTVSLPINDTQWYDLIIEKDDTFFTVQCKATQTDDNTISLRSTGGTKGMSYDNILNHSKLDYLFCVDNALQMWLIPVKDIITTNQISLRTTPNTNKQGFNTYLYQVYFPVKK